MSFTSTTTIEASRWRDVYIAAAARGITSCGSFMAVTALVLTLQPRGGLAVAALILATTVPLVVLAPLTGRLVDRADSRVLLVTAGAVQVATAAVLAAVAEQAVAVIAGMALLGAGQAVVHPTLAALTPSMVRRDDLPRASAVNQTASMTGMLAGPALAGLLVGAYGVRPPLLLYALSLTALVAAGLLVRTRRGGAPAPVPETAPVVRWTLWRDPILRSMVVMLAAVIAAVGAMNVVDVFFARDTLHASEAMYGLLEATWTAGMLAGAWLLARVARRARDDGALAYGLLATLAVMCATLPVAATVGAAAWLLPLWIAGGAGNGGLNVYSNVLVARRSPEPSRGRTYATVGATLNGAAMAGYLAGGPLVELLPTRPLIAGLGFAGLVVVGLLAPSVVRAVHHERIPTRSAAAPGADQRNQPDLTGERLGQEGLPAAR